MNEAFEEALKLMDEAGVVSVGQGEQDGRPAVVVVVSSVAAELHIPREIRGVPVRIQHSGPIRALDEE